MFMREFPDGSGTYFREKIRKCLYGETTRAERIEMLVSGLVNGPKSVKPKLHTIRPFSFDKDGTFKGCRYKEGMELSLRYWTGKPYRSSQEEFGRCVCKGIETIHVIYNREGVPNVYVGGNRVKGVDLEMLAMNDGFDSVEDFFKWFNKDFSGWIIHWTMFRYGASAGNWDKKLKSE